MGFFFHKIERTTTYSDKPTVKYIPKPLNIAGAVVALVLVLVLIANCFATIPTGKTGIVTTFGRVENYILDAGFHFKAP